MTDIPAVTWIEAGESRTVHWRSENGMAPPRRVIVADDRLTADVAYRLACEGTAILWRGDFHNAKQLLQAISRRIDRKPRRERKPARPVTNMTKAFHLHRQSQAQRARVLGMLLLPLDNDYRVPLRRAPDVRQACLEAYGPAGEDSIVSVRELLGLVGAHEWRKKGVSVPALNERIHPHYGVFSPVRGEYVQLVAEAPLPSGKVAFDIGTGTGVLAAVLARRGIAHIVATDQDPRALSCARENITRLGLDGRVEVVPADLYPTGCASLVVCNPPWIPAKPSAALEYAIYDPDSSMLLGFLNGLVQHLEPGGEGWLILSDIAEHLGLRTREELLSAIDGAGLKVVSKTDIRPHHPKTTDITDPLYAARAAEVTSLWRLVAA